MHEISVMESTLELAVNCARQQGAEQIRQMTLRVGTLSGVVPEALAFAFDVVVQGTIAQQARLTIKTISARCCCPNCGSDFQPPDWIFECPDCAHLCTEVYQGRELELASLEVS